IFHGPGAADGKRVPQVISTLDIGPTVLELLVIDPLKSAEGRSLVGYMTGETSPGPSVAFSDFLDDHRVITVGRWKLILRSLNVDFFDLKNDPWEQNELDPQQAPIAFRYSRVMLGQFLGARDRGRWIESEQGEGTRLQAEDAEMDESIKADLKALGYAN
ncbi:MAG: hypothetical protein ACOCUS_05915, partial [Polyangiales bacterium]